MSAPIFNIHDIILVLTLVVCLLLALFQGGLSKQKPLANYMLSGFFVCVGLGALANLLLWNIYLPDGGSFAKHLLVLLLVLATLGKGVLLLLYLLVSIRKDFAFTSTLPWLIPLFVLPILLVVSAGLESEHLRFNPAYNTPESIVYTNILWHFLKFCPLVFATISIFIVLRYKQSLNSYYSEWVTSGPYGLLMMISGFSLCWFWSFGVHILGIYGGVQIADFFGIFDNYLNFLLVNALFFYGLVYAPHLLQTRMTADEEGEKLTSSAGSGDLIQRIQLAMEKDALYLQPNLNIEEFSRHIGANYREISSTINSYFGTHFFDFVNSYRVEKAKLMLLDDANKHLTILDILLAVGFNSKSSFNRFFKRKVGMTAIDYRRQMVASKK